MGLEKIFYVWLVKVAKREEIESGFEILLYWSFGLVFFIELKYLSLIL